MSSPARSPGIAGVLMAQNRDDGSQLLIEMRDIVKRFPGVLTNDLETFENGDMTFNTSTPLASSVESGLCVVNLYDNLQWPFALH
jgi:hypothetical protein